MVCPIFSNCDKRHMTPYWGNLQTTNADPRILYYCKPGLVGVTRAQDSLVVSVVFYAKLQLVIRPGCYRLSVTTEISQRHVKDNDKEPKSDIQNTGMLSADPP